MIVELEVHRETFTGNSADSCAQPLHRRHEGVAEEHSPAEGVTKLCSDLAVGCDAAWVIVGRSGDEARTQCLEEALALLRGLDTAGRRSFHGSLQRVPMPR